MRLWVAVLAAAVVLLMAMGASGGTPPPDPTSITHTIGNFWVNHSWSAMIEWRLISGGYYGNFVGSTWTGSTWQSDSGIVSGLGDVGDNSAPNVFQKDGTWYLISGEENGVFNGYKWTGSAWQSDSGIVSGLGYIGGCSTPTVFQKDGTWYLISGEEDGVFNGYKWTGSAWQSDSGIVSGLGDMGDRSTPTVFQKDGTWYLISGEEDGIFKGYNWTGSAWQSDSGIVSGLAYIGGYATPTVFQKDGTWYLISGEYDGTSYGFNWDGSTWQSDPAITSGLGWGDWESASAVFGVYIESVADSYNISVNDVWHNGTTDGFWNNTGLSPRGWSNITVYAWNNSAGGSLSAGNVSQDTQISNNPITIIGCDWNGDPGANVYVDFDATDADPDTPTFSCRRTDLFTDFDTATGTGNWTAVVGTHYVDFGVSDGHGSTSNYTMTIMVGGGAPVHYLVSGEGDWGDYYGFNWTGSVWQTDTAMVRGLASSGNPGFPAYYTTPTIFQMDNTWYLISGDTDGGFDGYKWVGWTWHPDMDIVTGLGDVGSNSIPTVFQKDGTWHLISGETWGAFYGYNWTGSAWQSDSGIVSGLGDMGGNSAPTVFQKEGTWYLISSEFWGDLYGFNWTGSAWQSDSGIINGLGSFGIDDVKPTVFVKDGAWYLIAGVYNGIFIGYKWTGSAWESDGGIVSGLEGTGWYGGIGWQSAPTVAYGLPIEDADLLEIWWDDSWSYRERIEVNNTCGSNLDWFYVGIVLNTTQCAWEDCRDIRIINPLRGGSAYTWYTASFNDGKPVSQENEVIYVQVWNWDDNYAQVWDWDENDTAWIYVYYNNTQDVPSTCSGMGGMSYYEDFDDIVYPPPDPSDYGVDGFVHSGDTSVWSDELGGYCVAAKSGGKWQNSYKLLVQPTATWAGYDYWVKPAAPYDVITVTEAQSAYCTLGTNLVWTTPDVWQPKTYSFKMSAYCLGYPHTGIVSVTTTTTLWTRWDDFYFNQTYPCDPTLTYYARETKPSTYVILYDANQNLVQHAQGTVQNVGTKEILHRWKDIENGIIELNAAGTYQIAVRTFDGVFVHTVTVSGAQVANITIPLNYNLRVHPEDQFGTPLTEVFCGLSEYTPLNPQSFWGMSMSGSQYVPVTNCSGFAMCDLYAEKGGYADYNVTALNWTSRSAMVKDYRHDVVLAKE